MHMGEIIKGKKWGMEEFAEEESDERVNFVF